LWRDLAGRWLRASSPVVASPTKKHRTLASERDLDELPLDDPER
jgi:hypothetical protein